MMRKDLVIVGAGAAGLCAACEFSSFAKSRRWQKEVLIIELMGEVGGNSKRATSGINMLKTPIQEKEKVNDTYSLFLEDSLKSGKYSNDRTLLSTSIVDSHYLFEFLNEYGIKLDKLSILGGHSVARTHRPSSSTVGKAIIEGLKKRVDEDPMIKLLYNCRVVELLLNEEKNAVCGVKYCFKEDENVCYSIFCKAVILATGGYCYNTELISEYNRNMSEFPTTNGANAEGSGIKLARNIGIKLVNMDSIQLHPTGFVDQHDRFARQKILAPELLRGEGAILLNAEAKRFCNELGNRDYVSNAIIFNCPSETNGTLVQHEACLVMTQQIADKLENVSFYIERELLRKYELQDLAKAFKFPVENLTSTLQQAGFMHKQLLAGVVTPCVHYCMGGIKITQKGEAVRDNGKVMLGLYAAGEIVGGIHGSNRLGGNSLMDCLTFGRRVGVASAIFMAN